MRKEGGHKNELPGSIFPDSIIRVEYKTDVYLNVTCIFIKIKMKRKSGRRKCVNQLVYPYENNT